MYGWGGCVICLFEISYLDGVGVGEEELIACVHSYCGACSMLEDYKIKLVFAGKVCLELWILCMYSGNIYVQMNTLYTNIYLYTLYV